MLPAALNDDGDAMLVEDESVAASLNGVGEFLGAGSGPRFHVVVERVGANGDRNNLWEA